MTYDVIILAYSDNVKHRKITEDCIASLVKAENRIKVRITVLESYDASVKFENAKTVFFQQPKFNYNQSMNKGFSLTDSDYVFFCNNDLLFEDYWADNCYHAFKMGYDSLSPFCKASHPRWAKEGEYLIKGYQVGFHVAGWCIGVERKMFEKLGGFSEAVRFFYSDNIYAEQLKIEGVKHCLVCNSFVLHRDLGSKTLSEIPSRERRDLTSAQNNPYKKEVRRLWDAKKKKVRN